jgi:F0F1-type ATP synthase epsilon subunit
MLEAGTLTFKEKGQSVRVRITGGFAEVRDNVVTVLADGGELQS